MSANSDITVLDTTEPQEHADVCNNYAMRHARSGNYETAGVLATAANLIFALVDALEAAEASKGSYQEAVEAWQALFLLSEMDLERVRKALKKLDPDYDS